MANDHISLRQLLTLTVAALLSPAIRVLPGRSAAIAGEGGWLSALVALPLLLGLCWVLFCLLRDRDTGLGQAALAVLGPIPGRVVAGLYLAWGVFLLAVNARQAALRFLTVSYRNAPLPLFLAALLALTLWLAVRPLPVLGRAGEVFCLALTIVLALSLAMGAFQIRPGRLLPLWWQDLPQIAASGLPVLGLLGYVVFAAVLGGAVERPAHGRRKAMGWAVGLCLALTVLQGVCLGSFGPGLSVRMNIPFFMMVKGIGIEGTFQRVESVVMALWVLSDLALLALLACACLELLRLLLPVRRRSRAAPPLVLLALAGALWLFPDAFFLGHTVEWVVLAGNLIAGFALPLLLLLVKKLRSSV
ncbi:GerAB/ArcD/ProY family transporter [uncultured Flavonifractor sp.]|uniref:GerAB/ArcD/ProY family transporter n=1 Tax=uncultured Flavonifractor sp. TaxID=1193534 RepID=UPI00261E5754|nr:GerAB/ArcD/ProY family transporter [uncultured Flavonifractor sp.]